MKIILIYAILVLLNFKYISIHWKKIFTGLLLKIIDGLIKLKKPLLWLGGFFYLGIKFLAKIFILPFLLPLYRLFTRIKTYYRRLNVKQIPYLIFIKKYLPRLTIFILIAVVTSNNIFAQSYGLDEYVNKSLISALVVPDQANWSELIEDSGPATAPSITSTNYLQEQGAVQELVINTPFAEDNNNKQTNTSADDSSLVLLNPNDINDNEPVPTDTQRSEIIYYTVKAGDVLGKISEQFNITANTLLWANNLTWSSTIQPGQKLTILPSSGINHEVQKGDTIASIAKKYQADNAKIISANQLASAGSIKSGDLLFIPDGVKPTKVQSSYQPPKSIVKKPVTKEPENVYSDEEVPGAIASSDTKLLWPLLSQRITQYYSWKHTGLDVGDKVGNPIYAAESGKVERAGWSTGYGYNVVINHGNGLVTLYGHASKLLVKDGDTVSRGETIALIGNTGWSTGPHLHFEVRVNDARKNPLNYIR